MNILLNRPISCHGNVSPLSFVRGNGCNNEFRDTLQRMRRYSLDNDALPIRAKLVVAGCGCVVRTNSAKVISSLRKWSVSKEIEIETENEFEVSVLVDSGLQRQSALPQFRGRGRYVFATFHGVESFVFDLRKRTISAAVSVETAQDTAFWTTLLVPIAMGVLGPTLGLSPMHSACLEINGLGLLVAGVSGAGKSTLATALATEGMALVSDDWIYATEANGRVTVHGLEVPVKLMPDAARYFDSLRTEEPRISLNGERAFEIEARKLGIDVAERCEPKCIVFLERSDGQTRIAPLERTVAREFFERSAEPMPLEFAHAAEHRKHVIHSVTDRDCWHFQYAGTPCEGATFLRHFFEDIYHVEHARASAI